VLPFATIKLQRINEAGTAGIGALMLKRIHHWLSAPAYFTIASSITIFFTPNLI
jgi:hypothetical protein